MEGREEATARLLTVFSMWEPASASVARDMVWVALAPAYNELIAEQTDGRRVAVEGQPRWAAGPYQLRFSC